MSQRSSIEWTETTWNPVLGCSKVSSGCTNCYAERMAKRLASIAEASDTAGRSMGRTALYRRVVDERGRWNREILINSDALKDPYRWRTPRIVFVNSMSDLFHEKVPFSFIQQVFTVMSQNERHTFQILTKRPDRAAELAPQLVWSPNIWMGTSVEDRRVIERVETLKRIGAFVRFLSIEPLLGPLPVLDLEEIHWVIVGGESGPNARPLKKEWVVSIRDNCLDAEVPFFFKQWGGFNKKATGRDLDGRTWDEMPIRKTSFYAQA